MRNLRSVWLSLIVASALPMATLAGQEPEATTAEANRAPDSVAPLGTDAGPTAPQPIRPADITSQATIVSTTLEKIESEIRPNPEIAQIAMDFFGEGEAMAELRGELIAIDADTVTARRLEDQGRQWQLLAEKFGHWEQRVDQRWRELQGMREELLSIQQSWELTRDASNDEELPTELRQRADQILQRVALSQAEVRQRIDQMAEVIQTLTDGQELAAGSLKQLAELNERVNQRLFQRDSPSLWMVGSSQWRGMGESTWLILQNSIRDVRVFAVAHWPQVLMHLFFLAVLLMSTLQARASSRSWPADDPKLERARALLARPYSLAVALSIIPAAVIYGRLPAAVSDLFYLTLLISVLRHARALTRDGERFALIGILVLSAIHQLLFLSASGALLSRLTMLLIEVGILSIVGRVLIRVFSRRGSLVRWRRVALGCVGIALVFASVVAVIANLLGWVNLSQYLGESTLLTCRGFILLLLLVRAWSGLWSAILRRGPGRRLLSVRRSESTYARFGVALLAVPLTVYWVQQTLRRFRVLDSVESSFASAMETPLFLTANGLNVGDLVRAIVILAATVTIQKLLGFLLNEEFFPRLRFGASSTVVWVTLIKYAIVGAGLALAGSALGFNPTQLTVVFGALGVGIGLGLQDIVSNFISGLILMFERPVKIGDIVELTGVWGKVKNIGIRATLVETFEGSELLIPNRDLIVKEVKNWTLSGTTARVEVLVGTAYDSDPREVLEILLRTAREHEFVLEEPAPFAMMFGFGESALNFRMFCHTNMDKRGIVTSDLHISILEALGEAGIEIPFPQRDLRLTSVDKSGFEIDRLNSDQ